MKPPKEGPQRYYSTHRVLQRDPAVWQRFNPATEQWEPCAYEDVPDAIWRSGITQDGWRFYTDRQHPFPGPRPVSTAEAVEPGGQKPEPAAVLICWGRKEPAPMTVIASAVMGTSETGPVWMREIDTGSDDYCWVIADRELSDAEIEELLTR